MENSEYSAIVHGVSIDPHQFLGLHDHELIRIWRPGAPEMTIEVLGEKVLTQKASEAGLFTYHSPKKIAPQDYLVAHPSGLLAHDPYAFSSTIGEMDQFLFNKGCHYQLYRVLGAQLKAFEGVSGVQFAVWAPRAKSVSLVGDFNNWDGRIYPMRQVGVSGIWELFVPGLQEGAKYKFEIRSRDGYTRLKSDPVGFFTELRPKNASIVFDVQKYQWTDQKWVEEHARSSFKKPVNIYEVHLGSWKKYEGQEFGNYRQLAVDLTAYCKEMGFNYVELLPIMEHPLDESWGYQVTGFFAATSRFGTPEDFQFFVDTLHQNNIGVILDWVPGHFPVDDFALSYFDGTSVYGHEDPRIEIHPHWETAVFNYGSRDVANFLIASALYWIEVMHVDGLRVDAVSSMIYLDFGRKPGEWIPNQDGSNFNYDAIEFLKHMNSIVHQRHPGVMMMAEEASAFVGVTHPEGLNFDFKWNMGWMNDTLRYFARDFHHREHHQDELTFSLMYAYKEKFVTVLSHDEVVHLKKSLLSKMPGDEWQQFAGLRLLYSSSLCHPGKMLLFMGGEIGQPTEWACKGVIPWELLKNPFNQGMQTCVKELNHLYLAHPAIWFADCEQEGFEWIDCADSKNSVISYLRRGKGQTLAMIHNFLPQTHSQYSIPLKNVKTMREIFNTDAEKYGGSNIINGAVNLRPDGVSLEIAPLATIIFEVEFA